MLFRNFRVCCISALGEHTLLPRVVEEGSVPKFVKGLRFSDLPAFRSLIPPLFQLADIGWNPLFGFHCRYDRTFPL
jgi:hypothetical protein